MMNHVIRCYALSWQPALWHMISVTQWLLQTHSNSVTLRATQVVWTQIMATLGIWYIDEGFLVWIIPSTYQSHDPQSELVLLVLSTFTPNILFDVSFKWLCVLMLTTWFSMYALFIQIYRYTCRFQILYWFMIFILKSTSHCLYMYVWTTSLDHVNVWLPEHAN